MTNRTTLFLAALLTPLAFAQTSINNATHIRGVAVDASNISACDVVGDHSTDDTAAIQKCIDDAPDYTKITFRFGARMKITSTINIAGRYGIRLSGNTSMWGGPNSSTLTPSFYWFGVDGGTMFNIDHTQNFLIEGLTFYASPGFGALGGSHGASDIISIDQTAAGSGGITTNGILERVAVLGTEANPDFRGILFSLTSNSNVEHMTVRDSYISCSYTGGVDNAIGQGIVLGPTQNGQGHLYERNSITNCSTGIYSAYGGGANIIENQFNTNKTHIYFGTPYPPIRIEGNDSENCYQFLRTLGGSFFIANNRIAAATPQNGDAVIALGSGNSTLINNILGDIDFIPVSTSSNNTCPLLLINNSWGAASAANVVAGMAACSYGTFGIDAGSGIYTTGSGAPMPKTVGLTRLAYNATLNKWLTSMNGAEITPLITEGSPGVTFGSHTLGSCGTATDLVSTSSLEVSSSAIPFNSGDSGGYVHISGGTGWTVGDYYMTASGSGGAGFQYTPCPGGGCTGGTFIVNRGRHVLVQGGAGVADVLKACVKSVLDTYSWVTIY